MPTVAGDVYECDSLALGGTCVLSCGPGYVLRGAPELNGQLSQRAAQPVAAPSLRRDRHLRPAGLSPRRCISYSESDE